MNRTVITICTTCALFGPHQTASAQTWNEIGDADTGLFFGDNQETVGVGPLTAINGSIGDGDGTWDTSDDHVDAFRITITDSSAFFASLRPSDGGSFLDASGSQGDSRMYLFDLGGNLVMANDDAPDFSLQSYLSDPSTYPGGLANSPGSVVSGMDYVLAVTYNSNDVLDGGGIELADLVFNSTELNGINPASLSGVGATWENPGLLISNSWTYTVALGGAEFSTVPAPGAVALLGSGALFLSRRRRGS